jgi:hypothetical protein
VLRERAGCLERRVPGWLHRIDPLPAAVFHFELQQTWGSRAASHALGASPNGHLGQLTNPLTSPPEPFTDLQNVCDPSLVGNVVRLCIIPR